ncbi:uncharacterized protein LOC110710944 isoform X1 [Chenopodium quinoa]|uniref:uncharacterized protein LOC110710944 isoform X1 n=1 Tax=Chenopodium quinoa TaxID=63459 RepID=UPI000B78AA59|nr:uncharacterized protein LOC110710944 isoform X1 [Chenopodium quinoa]XP_021744975.1 uncharacterized protein LOC110710944 isoform X1 [Chenopodium quinoa]
MGDHLALLVNRLLTESTIHAAIESRNRAKEIEEGKDVEFLMPIEEDDAELSSPRKVVECRICQDEDFDSKMETPCSCSGSLKYAHRRCVQRWCNEKGDINCEICHQPFRPGYSAPPPLLRYGRIPMNFSARFFIRRNWQISRRELVQSQLMEAVSTDHDDLLDEFEEPSSRSLLCRFTVAVIFIGLLILRHTLPIVVGGADDHEFVLPLFILAMLRVSGILMLVYVTMMAVTGLRRQRNQDETPSILETSSDEEVEHPDSEQPSHVIQIS